MSEQRIPRENPLAEKEYKFIIGGKIKARSRGEALNKVWGLLGKDLVPHGQWVSGEELREVKGWAKHFISQLTGK